MFLSSEKTYLSYGVAFFVSLIKFYGHPQVLGYQKNVLSIHGKENIISENVLGSNPFLSKIQIYLKSEIIWNSKLFKIHFFFNYVVIFFIMS